MAGCAGYHVQHGWNFKTDPKSSVSDGRMLDVPFFPDKTDQCGPSALASVLSFWGPPVEPRVLKKEIYLAQLKGSLPIDLLLAAQNRGFEARLYNGSIDDLKSELRKGHPLVAFLNRGFDFFPIGHYVVVSGYDEAREGLYVDSGSAKDQFVRYKCFLRNWDKTQRSTLLILPRGRDAKSLHDHDKT
jgi:hypothetical protein